MLSHVNRTPAPASSESPETALADPTPVNRHTGEILATPPKYLAGVPIITDPDALIERSMERIMNATTAEEALSSPDSLGLRDLTGQVITLESVIAISPSGIREGDYYLIFEARRTPGGPIETMTTGSPFAAGRIVKCAREGWLPRQVRILQLESASNPGQSSLWVVDAEPTVKGTDGNADF